MRTGGPPSKPPLEVVPNPFPFDQSALRKQGKWKRVKGKRFSRHRALSARRKGAKLSFTLGRSDAVKILAARGATCGKLASVTAASVAG